MSELRFKVVEEAIKRKAVCMPAPAERASEYFGMYVFNEDKMRKYLPKKTYEALFETMKHGKALSREIADSVASGMKQWAMDMGATHYTHWFQPLYGRYGRKTRRFLSSTTVKGGVDRGVFRRSCSIQQEPDASSFPERRYPQYVRSARLFGLGCDFAGFHSSIRTLCIPTHFYRLYRGSARLQGTACFESLQAIDRAAIGGVPATSIRRMSESVTAYAGMGAGVLSRRRGAFMRLVRTWC